MLGQLEDIGAFRHKSWAAAKERNVNGAQILTGAAFAPKC